MFKKRILLLLLSIMLIVVFVGCGTKTQPSSSTDQTQQNEASIQQEKPSSLETAEPEPQSTEASKEETKTEQKTAGTEPANNPSSVSSSESAEPTPAKWQDVKINKDNQLPCTLTIKCDAILNNMDKFNKDKIEVLPEDGIVLAKQQVMFYEGESVFNVLQRETKKNKIQFEFEKTPVYNSNYIEGINNIYEFDCGPLSGWIYKVNGVISNYGVSGYIIKDGDDVEIIYTCDLGRDAGADNVNENYFSGRKGE